MKVITKLTAAAVGAGVVIRQVSRSRARPAADASREPASRWRAVTVRKPASEVAPDGVLPPPLAELGDTVEVRITAAPDGKGTELAARLRDGEPPATARLGDRYPGSRQQTGDTVARKRERRRRKATPAVSPRARRAGARSVSPPERKDPDGPSAADPFVAGVPAADRT